MVSEFHGSQSNVAKVLTVEHGKGEQVGEERVGERGEEQRKHDQQCPTKAHLPVGEAAEEGSIAQPDAVGKCRVHVYYGCDLTGGYAEHLEVVTE